MGNDERKRMVKSLDTTFVIIEYLSHQELARITDISDDLNLSKSTIHEHLTTLVDKGYVAKNAQKYGLSLKFLDIGGGIREHFEVYRGGRQTLRSLSASAGGLTRLFVEEFGESVCIDEEVGDHGIYTVGRLGNRDPIHATAAGKAMLAHFPIERRDEIMSRRELVGLTAQTITDEDTLQEELESIQERGFAYNDNERVEGVRAVASPIIVGENVMGSLAVAGPTNWMKNTKFKEEIPALVMESANEIELRIEYGDS